MHIKVQACINKLFVMLKFFRLFVVFVVALHIYTDFLTAAAALRFLSCNEMQPAAATRTTPTTTNTKHKHECNRCCRRRRRRL